ncbi:TPA: right-handed parallel beta-helix repeat-containing protein [Enterobacter asburiae]
MTVSTVVDHNDYTGNGVTTSFPYTFRIFKKTDLTVSVIDLSENITVLVLDTDYTVTNAGGFNGGSVVLTSPLANGWQISIARELEPTQETDLRNQGKFFAEVHEDALDKLTMLIQQVGSMFHLALRKPSSIANWYDALNNYIRNVKDPVLDQDAVNKRTMRDYVDKALAGVVGGYGWFIQSGAGAVYRTFQDKMRDVLNVTDFGAVGDGVSDDTAAFQLAVNKAGISGGEIKLKSGCIYRINGFVQLKSNVHIDLSGCTILKNGSGSCFYAENINNFSVFNGRIYTSLSYPSSPPSVVQADNFGIGINKCSRFKISNLDIRGFGDCGIVVASSSASSSGEVVSYSTITECNVSYCYNGIKFVGYFPSEYISVTSCFGYKNNFAGCHIEAGNIYISASSFSTNSLYGLYLKSSDNGGHGNASGCSFNHNSGKNILIDGLQQGFMFSGCNIFDDAGSDPYSGMIQFAGCKGVIFSGCQIMANIQADGLSSINQFIGCSFYGTRNYLVSSTDGTSGFIVFTNCTQGAGAFKANLPGTNSTYGFVSADYSNPSNPSVVKFNQIGSSSGAAILDATTGISVAQSTGIHCISFKVTATASFTSTLVANGSPHSKFSSSQTGSIYVCSGTVYVYLQKGQQFNVAIECPVGTTIQQQSTLFTFV